MEIPILLPNIFNHPFTYKTNIKLKIGSKGYTDIKDAVFFELKNKDGYLYQYSKEGVSYNCVNNQ